MSIEGTTALRVHPNLPRVPGKRPGSEHSPANRTCPEPTRMLHTHLEKPAIKRVRHRVGQPRRQRHNHRIGSDISARRLQNHTLRAVVGPVERPRARTGTLRLGIPNQNIGLWTKRTVLRAFPSTQLLNRNLPVGYNNGERVGLPGGGFLHQNFDKIEGHDLSDGVVGIASDVDHFDRDSSGSFSLSSSSGGGLVALDDAPPVSDGGLLAKDTFFVVKGGKEASYGALLDAADSSVEEEGDLDFSSEERSAVVGEFGVHGTQLGNEDN